jgi:hypothetical protein
MRRAAAMLAPFFLAACAASTTTVGPSLLPSATPTQAVTPSPTVPGTPAATIAPTQVPTEVPSPTATLAPTPSTSSSEPPAGPAVFGPAMLTTSGEPVPNSDLGGCGSLWWNDTIYSSDDCGPHEFKLDAQPVVVAPGGTMTFASPAGYQFSVDRIAASPQAVGTHSWAVAIAPISSLVDLPLGQQEGITPEHGGRVLGYGDRAVISAWVKAPTQKGEYLVQLDASVNLGAWTFTWPRFFWRVSVQ